MCISDIRNYFVISEIILWYLKLFFISENAMIFWYQKLFPDIRKFPLVFAKMNRYFIMFVVPENKLGHDPVVTSSQENIMKCGAPWYSWMSCKLHNLETCHLKIRIHLCRLLVWIILSGKHRNNLTSLWIIYTCSDAVFTSSVFMLN